MEQLKSIKGLSPNPFGDLPSFLQGLNQPKDKKALLKFAVDHLATTFGPDVVVMIRVYSRTQTSNGIQMEITNRPDFLQVKTLGLAAQAVAEQSPLLASDHRSMVVPMFDQQILLGIIYVAIEARGSRSLLTSVDLNTLTLFAMPVTNTIRHARYQRRLKTLSRITQSLSLEQNFDVLLSRICRRTAEVLEVDAVCLWLVEKETRLTLEGQWGLKTKIDPLRPAKVDLKEYVGREAIREGQPITITNLSDSKQNFFNQEGLMSAVIAPIFRDGHLLGSLEIYSRQHTNVFTIEDESILSSLTLEASAAMGNTRYIQQLETLNRSKQRLEEAGEALARVYKLDEALETITRNVSKISQLADGALTCFYNFATDLFEPEKSAGWGLGGGQMVLPTFERPRLNSILDMSQGNDLIDCLNPAGFQRLSPRVQRNLRDMGIHGFLGLRLKTSEEPIGILFVNYAQVDGLSAADKDTEIYQLRLYANLAAAALERAYLYNRALVEQEIWDEVALNLQTDWNLEQKTWTRILQRAQTLTGAERGNIILRDRQQWRFHVSLGFREEQDPSASPVTQAIVSWITKHRQTVRILDLHHNPTFKHLVTDQTPTRSVLATLIRRGRSEEIVGIIHLKSDQVRAFDAHDEAFIEQLAVRADIAIRNARAIGQIRTLNRVAQNMINHAGKDPELVFQAILKDATQATGSYLGTLQMLREDENGKYLEFIATSPQGELEEMKRIHGRMPLNGPGITTWAARDNDAKLVGDVSLDNHFMTPYHRRTRSELAVVLRENGRPIGVLNVEHQDLDGLNEDDRTLLIVLSDMVVLAFQNATKQQEFSAVEAVAWHGLFGSNWWHTACQRSWEIKNHLYMLEKYHLRDAEPEVHQLLSNIEEAAETMSALPTQQWLPSSLSTPMDSVLIDPTIEEMVYNICRAYGTPLKFQPGCPGVEIQTHRELLEVGIEKIVKNSIQAMKGSGELSVSTSRSASAVEIFIQDNGPGIPEGIKPHFLKANIPKSAQESGFGMGGIIAQFVFQRCGGTIKLLDSTSQGTLIKITLPISEETT
ncbi:MAG: GAF domain-containing protein [Ardenticatenaceae bacterium]|nr:GAF domain-containing protein [Ardenticatenaceae bacterium]